MTVNACKAELPSRRAARREERRAAIVSAAHCMFQEAGFGGTTMSAIAAALGGSKSTLWAYFSTKEELFAAVLDRSVKEFQAIPLDEAAPLEPTLLRYAEQFLTLTLSPPVIALNRLVIGEVPRFPELGRIFYAQGPERQHHAVARYFAAQIARGRVRPVDPLLASRQFHHLCQGGLFIRTLWGVADPADAAAIQRDAANAVELFLNGYSVEGAV
jgi:TetR/AcrR family transcriptional repressor of mexJK operon